MQKGQTRFSSMPNFRTLIEDIDTECQTTKIYRSSRPDMLTQEEIEHFRELGIRSIIDFRAAAEYKKAVGSKLLDHYYPRYAIKLPLFGEVPVNKVKAAPVSAVDEAHKESLGKHYLINFFKLNYVWNTFCKASIWFRLYSMIYLIYDIIFNTGYKYWIRAFAKEVLNKEGLSGQYVDMINMSKAAIYVALKLLSEPENVPAMINCAHGKDRTGIVSALVLSLMGKTKEEIVADYTRTSEELSVVKERIHFEIVVWLGMCPTFTRADAQNMKHMLDYIDNRYGSVSAYLESFGFSKQDQEKLRRNLRSNQ